MDNYAKLVKNNLNKIFRRYNNDEDFPTSVTCLYSNNADQFLPIDGLADIGEYSSKKLLILSADL